MPNLRIKITQENTIIIERFSEELKRLIADISNVLEYYFDDSIEGQLGSRHREIVLKLFNEWCTRSDIPTLTIFNQFLLDKIRQVVNINRDTERRRILERLYRAISRELRIKRDKVIPIINEVLAEIEGGKNVEKAVWKGLINLYKDIIGLYLYQTAHVIIGRFLLYRVLEDKKLAEYKLIVSTEKLQRMDTLSVLAKIREELENLLPNIYGLGEFDWWYYPDVYRGLLSDKQRKLLARHENTLKRSLRRAILTLALYDFEHIDFDVWQNIYQHYLPEEERQRLGGFYTKPYLVSLILDLAGYVPERRGICHASVLDPACGSGTFVIEAARRLIVHLKKPDLNCHKLPKTEWEKAKFILETVKNNIYAIDIHPFATFLTSMNLIMLLIEYFFKVHHQDRIYSLELNVITADSLIKELQSSITDFINARIKKAYERSIKLKEILDKKFDYIFGNPPWGTVLKGQLSPLWNPQKREEYKKNYRSATGKYDIYVLFLEKGIEWLDDRGTLSMVVNNRFMTRDFGQGIRSVIVENTKVESIVDLADFGEELFNATNYPAIITLRKTREPIKGIRYIKVHKHKGIDAKKAVEIARDVLKGVSPPKNVDLFIVSQGFLAKYIEQGWFFSEALELIEKITSIEGYKISEILSDVQGVTTGANEIFILDNSRLEELKNEDIDLAQEPLLKKVIAGEDIKAWRIMSPGKWIMLPYEKRNGKWVLAFMCELKGKEVDLLDFDKDLDNDERGAAVTDKLNNRIAKGYIKYPNTAKYLVKYYDRLRNRVFEEKSVEEYAGSWYAYHRKRDLDSLLSRPKIVVPRICREVSFALDQEGFLPLDNVVALVPREEIKELIKDLTATLGGEVNLKTTLLYVMSFLNSPISNLILREKTTQIKGGYRSISEKYLSKLVIPRPREAGKKAVLRILSLSAELSNKYSLQLHKELNNVIIEIFSRLLAVPFNSLKDALQSTN